MNRENGDIMTTDSAAVSGRNPLDRLRTITVLLWIAFAAVATVQLLPLLTGVVVDKYGLDPSQAGLVAACYYGAGFVSSLFAFYWLPRWDRRTMLFIWLSLGLVGELSTVFFSSMGVLAVGRLASGFASAAATCIVLSAFTSSSRSERLYGIWAATGSLLTAIVYVALPFILPSLYDSVGRGALFVVFAVFWLVALVIAFAVPKGTTSSGLAAERAPSKVVTPGVVLVLASIIVFYIAMIGVWAFVERVGVWTGLGSGQISLALSVSQVAAVLGGLGASVIGLRFKVVLPIVAGLGLSACANLLLLPRAGMVGFSVAVFMSVGFTIFTVGAYLQALGVLDPSGRLMAGATTASFAGSAVGPVIVGLIIPAGHNPSYAAALLIDTGVFAVAAVLFVAGWALARKRVGETESVLSPEPAVTGAGVTAG
jgi:predicted MFS family arabinose efflux permease